jgi:hypothetical protein
MNDLTNYEWSPKDPGEQINYGIDFSTILPAAVTISNCTVSVALKNGVGLVGDLVLIGSTSLSGQTATQRLSAGTDGAEYIVTFTITASTGEIFKEAKCLSVSVKTC